MSVNTEIVGGHRPEFKRTEVSMSEETKEFSTAITITGRRPASYVTKFTRLSTKGKKPAATSKLQVTRLGEDGVA